MKQLDYFHSSNSAAIQHNKKQYLREMIKNNAVVVFATSVLLFVIEIAVLFLQEYLFETGWVIYLFIAVDGLLMVGSALVLKHKETVSLVPTMVFQNLYAVTVIMFGIMLAMLSQQAFDLVHVYIMTVLFMVTFLDLYFVNHAVLITLMYLVFAFLLPVFQADPVVASVMRLNTFIGNIMALVLARIVIQYKRRSFINKMRVEEQNEILSNMIECDRMTGLLNHSCTLTRLEDEIGRSKHSGVPLSIIMVDIDYFKTVNDCYGHVVGDEVICLVAEEIRLSERSDYYTGRYGGEEFLIVLPNTKAEEALEFAEYIRDRIYNLEMPVDYHVTISAGVSEYCGESLNDFVSKTDQKLYCAKARGRNQCVERFAEAV